MRYGVILLLAIMALAGPMPASAQGSGETPGDPILLKPSGYYRFTIFEAVSTPPNDITHTLYEVYAPGDSVAVWSAPHITELDPDASYIYTGYLKQVVPGALVRLTVWSPDAESGLTDYCTRWVMVQEHHGGGCACEAL